MSFAFNDEMVYFIFSLLSLFLYALFMILKFSFRVEITKAVVFFHTLSAFFAFITFFTLLLEEFTFTPLSLLGVVFIIPGILFIVLASSKLGSQTFKPRNVLVSSGIYSYVRNPMYSGIILLSLGSVFFSYSLYILIYSLVLVVSYLFVIKAEEKELLKRFGKEYYLYSKKVPSLIPKLKNNL